MAESSEDEREGAREMKQECMAGADLAEGEAEEEVPTGIVSAGTSIPTMPGGDSAPFTGSTPSAVAKELYLGLAADVQPTTLSALVEGEGTASLHASALRLQRLRASESGLFVHSVLELLSARTVSAIARRVRALQLSPFDDLADSGLASEGTAKDFHAAYFITMFATRLVNSLLCTRCRCRYVDVGLLGDKLEIYDQGCDAFSRAPLTVVTRHLWYLVRY